MLINLNDILTLDENERYIVMAGIAYDQEKYYYLLKVDENNNISNYKARIMKEIENESSLQLQDIEGQEGSKKIKELLNESFEKLYSDFLK